MFLLMANKRKTAKKSKFTHCKITLTSHPKAPFRVSYPVEVDGKTVRKRRMFATEQKAMDFAEEHERDVADYGVRFGSITSEARRAFDSYRDAKADLGKAGIEVPSFEMLVAAAIASLRAEHEERQKARLTVAEAIEGFLGYKKSRVGKGRLSGVKGHCGRFSEQYGTTPLDRVTGAEIESWLFALKGKKTGAALDAVTRNKMRKDLKELFSYGLDPERGWCHRNPLASIKLETETVKPPKAYSVAESEAILKAVLDLKSPALPIIVLGLFSGLRPSEAMAIDLSAINLSKKQFRTPDLKPDGTKTKTRTRMASLTPAAAVWFALQDRRSGLAWQGKEHDLKNEINRIFSTAKVKKIFDGLRHSYVTYRCAEIGDVNKVADECGNSPAVIKKNYREIVPTEIGEKFFSLRPEKTGRKTA